LVTGEIGLAGTGGADAGLRRLAVAVFPETRRGRGRLANWTSAVTSHGPRGVILVTCSGLTGGQLRQLRRAAIPTVVPITTVRQPLAEIGSVAAQVLGDLIDGNAPSPSRAELSTDLIVRGSTAAPGMTVS
jgi:hypothetical protein